MKLCNHVTKSNGVNSTHPFFPPLFPLALPGEERILNGLLARQSAFPKVKKKIMQCISPLPYDANLKRGPVSMNSSARPTVERVISFIAGNS